nr:zinc knuckle CX2CX4HX4C [Tanacetum cinerariifolium]
MDQTILKSHVENPEKFKGSDFRRWQQKVLLYLTSLHVSNVLTHSELTDPYLVDGENVPTEAQADANSIEPNANMVGESSSKSKSNHKIKGKNYGGSGQNHSKDGKKDYTQQNKYNFKRVYHCWVCRKPRNKAKDCRHKKEHGGGNSGGNFSQANHVESSKEFDGVNEPEPLFMGNKTALKIEGKGKVILKLTSRNELVLSNVLHVANITKNLIFGPTLSNKGFKVVFESDEFVITKGGVYVEKGYLNEGLFKLSVVTDENVINNENSGTSTSSVYMLDLFFLCHSRLGHVNFRSLQKLINLEFYENTFSYKDKDKQISNPRKRVLDNELSQDQRDNTSEVLQENAKPRRSRHAKVNKNFGPDYMMYIVNEEPQIYKAVIESSKAPYWKEMNKSICNNLEEFVVKGQEHKISNHNEGKSTSGYVFTHEGVVVSWKSSKQTVNTRSTREAEFIALDKSAEEAEWLRSFLQAKYYRIFLIDITYTRLMFGRIFGNQMAKFSKILMNKDMFTTKMNTTVRMCYCIDMLERVTLLVIVFVYGSMLKSRFLGSGGGGEKVKKKDTSLADQTKENDKVVDSSNVSAKVTAMESNVIATPDVVNTGKSEKVLLVKGFFFFKFSSNEGVESVPRDGQWINREVLIFLNKWSPSKSILKDELPRVLVWVKFHDVSLVAYTSDGLSLIATKIEIDACNGFRDNLVMGVPNLEGPGYMKETIRVEYEWEPPHCSTCLIFGHSVDDCPKAPKRVVNRVDKVKDGLSGVDDDGFIEPGQTNASTSGNGTFSLSNSFEVLNVDSSVSEDVDSGDKTFMFDMQEERQMSTPIVENSNIVKQQLLARKCVLLDDEGKPVKKIDYTSDHDSEDEELFKKPGQTNASTSGNGTFSLSNSFEVLNVDSSVSEDVDSGDKTFMSGMQEERQMSTPIVENSNIVKQQLLSRKCVLLDDEGKPVKKIDYTSDHDSEDEVELVDNETSFLSLKPSRVGNGTNSLLEQWSETYKDTPGAAALLHRTECNMLL